MTAGWSMQTTCASPYALRPGPDLRAVLTAAACVLLVACGGGGGGSSAAPAAPPVVVPPAPSISVADAARFLRQASFGPTPADVAALRSAGYEQWIAGQVAAAPSLERPYMQALPAPASNAEGQANRVEAWLRHAVLGPDQLRQRVAFALSEIMVVSDRGALSAQPNGLAYYYDLLVQNAFGNFRELMEVVTLSPAMGVYLSMLGNEKPDAARNIRPDENYARELLQLFTVGLVELDPEGRERRDGDGIPLPAFDQSVIEGFAHVFTGWTFGGSTGFRTPSRNYERQMQAFAGFHDTGAKRLLNGVVLPPGQTPQQDLEAALDNIFAHPNVPPFISRQLIQRLVTANPSPAYVGRVARVFENDGSGTRGNLAAVVRAILLDAEARSPAAGDGNGKLTEPLLRLVAVWRAYGARAASGRYRYANPEAAFAQAPLRAPSVFNFFSPQYAPAGEIRTRGLVSPEMEITNETTTGTVDNQLATFIYTRNSTATNLGENDIFIDIDAELAFAGDAAVVVDRAATRLLGGAISAGLRADATAMVARIPASSAALRVAEAIHFIAASPEFAVLQ
jgi:uncharacterized protein (DUF1800 family)